MRRTIGNTSTEAQQNWPPDVFIQGGERGVVLGGPGGAYQTAFFEAFPSQPRSGFLRGEGSTLQEAEDACWSKYQIWAGCNDGSGEHGPYERRKYTNGAGFCTKCGTWMSKVFEPIADDPNRERSLVERVFVDHDPDAVLEVLTTVADAASLPPAPSNDTTIS